MIRTDVFYANQIRLEEELLRQDAHTIAANARLFADRVDNGILSVGDTERMAQAVNTLVARTAKVTAMREALGFVEMAESKE